MTWIELALWISIGIWDLYLKFRGHKTISKQIEAFLPQGVDVGIVLLLLVVVWGIYGPADFVVALRWCMIGHVLLGHETFTKWSL